MGSYALIKNGVVVNTIVYGGAGDYDPGEGIEMVEYGINGTVAGIGWLYSNGEFTAPPMTAEEIQREVDARIDDNKHRKETLMAQASSAIAPLQDAVDFDEAIGDEEALLKKWKLYRIAVNRINANTESTINWPDQPV